MDRPETVMTIQKCIMTSQFDKEQPGKPTRNPKNIKRWTDEPEKAHKHTFHLKTSEIQMYKKWIENKKSPQIQKKARKFANKETLSS